MSNSERWEVVFQVDLDVVVGVIVSPEEYRCVFVGEPTSIVQTYEMYFSHDILNIFDSFYLEKGDLGMPISPVGKRG